MPARFRSYDLSLFKEGLRFNALTVQTCDFERNERGICHLCRCECGKEVVCSSRDLIKDLVKSCGCKIHQKKIIQRKLDQKYLKEIFFYDDGKLYWKKEKGAQNRTLKKTGTVAGGKNLKGYWTIHVCGKRHLLHRLIYLYFHGFIPSQVDHIDQDKGNSRIENLRASDAKTNRQNVGLNKANKSGYKGVSWSEKDKRFYAKIKHDGKTLHLGITKTAKDAAIIYDFHAIKYFGEFAWTNFPKENYLCPTELLKTNF